MASTAPVKEQPTASKELPKLNIMADDDEFEDFGAEDWATSETFEATLSKDGKSTGLDSLWEDSWDDDAIEDDFSVQLRGELLKQGQAGAKDQKMN